MATSAQTLSTILDTLAKEFNFDKTEACQLLASESLLPKKLMPSPAAPVKKASPWGSKKAEELAAEHGIIPTRPGSGKDGKWILSDVKKLLETPVKEKPNASPHAVKLALEHNIDLKEVEGSGKDGKILLKDVEKLIEDEESDDEEESDEEN
jgi:pyruvate/2-oxoglutarate dehydrogenase complex dihydrolipoamide acyltransferase (E2) component